MASDAPPPPPSTFPFPPKPTPTSTPTSTPTPTPNPNPNLLLDFNTPSNDAVFTHPTEDDEIDVDDDDVIYDSVKKPPGPISPVGPTGPPYPIDESRKLFQRLWTDEDEIELLQGFLDYNSQRGGGGNNQNQHHDTTAFYDQIKTKLQLDFNKNQLVEKLRRLKKKYRNVVQKIGAGKEYVLKSPHDQATFEISKKIWGAVAVPVISVANTNNVNVNMNTPVKVSQSPDEGGINDEEDDPSPNTHMIAFSPNSVGVDEKISRAKKRQRVAGQAQVSVGVGDQAGVGVVTSSVIEETIRSCLSPIFKELLNGVMNLSNGARGVGGLTELAAMPLGLGFGGFGGGGVDLGAGGDEKWRNQQILELEVFSKRLELVQDRIKVQLEELRGKGS